MESSLSTKQKKSLKNLETWLVEMSWEVTISEREANEKMLKQRQEISSFMRNYQPNESKPVRILSGAYCPILG